MTRLVHAASAVLIILAVAVGVAYAQAKTFAPIKGDVEIALLPIKAVPDYKTKMVDTVIKVKNISPTGSIAGLKVVQYWWDKAGSPQPVGAADARLKKPLQPGEEATLTLQLPIDPKMFRDSYVFTHANGKVKPKQVKTF